MHKKKHLDDNNEKKLTKSNNYLLKIHLQTSTTTQKVIFSDYRHQCISAKNLVSQRTYIRVPIISKVSLRAMNCELERPFYGATKIAGALATIAEEKCVETRTATKDTPSRFG